MPKTKVDMRCLRPRLLTPCATAVLLITGILFMPAELLAAQAPTPTLSTQVAFSANVSGSLTYQCSSQDGILGLLQQNISAEGSISGFNVTLPADLQNPLAVSNIAQIAWEYIYSYPLPVLANLLAVSTSNGSTSNTFYERLDHLSTPNDTGAANPNDDTLYASAFLDLSQGPQTLSVPAFDPGRYWEVPFLDAYTNDAASIGSRTDNTAGDYLIVGRDAPYNATYTNFTADRVIHGPTDIMQILARVLVFNDSDTPTAAQLLNAITLAPYNSTANSSSPASKSATISQLINSAVPSTGQSGVQLLDSLAQDPAAWFNFTAAYVAIEPPANGTGLLETALADLSADASTASSLVLEAFRLGLQAASQCITSSQVDMVTPTGWTFWAGPTWGAQYLARAESRIPRFGLGEQPVQEATIMSADTDSQNQTLDASSGSNYTINFLLPLPASAFWSVTMYNATSFEFINNPINRYSIGDRTEGLVFGGANNSSLEVFIPAQQPQAGSTHLANWLPAPDDAAFVLRLRLYEPTDTVLAGDYEPPAVVRA